MWAPFLWNGFVLWRTTTNVTWAQDVSEPLQICLFKRSKLSSGKTWVSLARQFHLPLLVKESIAGWDCPVGHSCVQEANFCCPCKLLPSSHPHCGCQRHNLSLGFPHFLLTISLSPISCLFLCALQQGGLRVFGVSRLGLVLLVEHWRKSTEMYCLHRARPSSGSEIQREEKNVRVKTASVYVRPQCTSCLLASGAAWFGLAAEQAGEYVLRHGHWKGYSWFFACSQSCLCEALLAPNRSSSVYPALVHTRSYAGRQGRFSKIFKGTGYSEKPGISYEGFVRYGHSRISNGLKSGPETHMLPDIDDKFFGALSLP